MTWIWDVQILMRSDEYSLPKGMSSKNIPGQKKHGEGMVFEHPFSHIDNQEKGLFL